MSTKPLCWCCLVRPPDKDLKSSYTFVDKHEVYGDMLKECFGIHLSPEPGLDNGICEKCISRLRDACDFKHQVVRCQDELQLRITAIDDVTDIKEEVTESQSDDPDFTVIIDIPRRKCLTRKTGKEEKKKTRKKRQLIIDTPVKESKSKSLKSSINVTLSTLPTIQFVSDIKKHSINVENILKYSNCTPFSNKTLSGIICAYCKEMYKKPDELRAHTKDSHNKCELNFNSLRRLDKVCIKLDITDLKCNLCDKNLDVIANLKKHLSDVHSIIFYSDVYDYILEFKLTEEDLTNCALCHSKFETFKMLIHHMNGHYRNFVCDVCDAGFINKERLQNHKRSHEVGLFKCAFCEEVFNTRLRKMCHEKKLHKTNTKYTSNCPHCERTFTSYYQRNRHMFNDHNVSALTYKCNVCDKTFLLKSKLTSHIKKVHLMERNHICSECGQSFFRRNSLDAHMIKHNGERVFKCTVCHKAYARKKTLREHMRIHNNDRRFKCDICALAFVQKCSLKSHMLSNHGITLLEYENSRSVIKDS